MLIGNAVEVLRSSELLKKLHLMLSNVNPFDNNEKKNKQVSNTLLFV